MDLLLLEDSMTAFVAISTDSFYLTCFQNPCWILFFCLEKLHFLAEIQVWGLEKNVQNDFADGLL